MAIKVGYSIANIAALTAIIKSERTNGYARLVLEDAKGETSWHTFFEARTDAPNGETILADVGSKVVVLDLEEVVFCLLVF